MIKIGILQGRVLPQDLNRLQVFPKTSWRKELDQVAALGFDYVEVLHDQEGLCNGVFSRPENQRIFESEIRLPFASACLDSLVKSSALRDPKEFCDKICHAVGMLSNFGVKNFIIPFFGCNLIERREDLQTVLCACVDEGLAEYASSRGVVLCIEVDLPEGEIRDAMSRLDGEPFGVCYALGNARAKGFLPHEEILLLNDLIRIVHIKDRPVGGPNVMLGEGDVDFIACFHSLKEIAYDGLLTLETCYRKDPAAEAEQHLSFVKSIWEKSA